MGNEGSSLLCTEDSGCCEAGCARDTDWRAMNVTADRNDKDRAWTQFADDPRVNNSKGPVRKASVALSVDQERIPHFYLDPDSHEYNRTFYLDPDSELNQNPGTIIQGIAVSLRKSTAGIPLSSSSRARKVSPTRQNRLASLAVASSLSHSQNRTLQQREKLEIKNNAALRVQSMSDMSMRGVNDLQLERAMWNRRMEIFRSGRDKLCTEFEADKEGKLLLSTTKANAKAKLVMLAMHASTACELQRIQHPSTCKCPACEQQITRKTLEGLSCEHGAAREHSDGVKELRRKQFAAEARLRHVQTTDEKFRQVAATEVATHTATSIDKLSLTDSRHNRATFARLSSFEGDRVAISMEKEGETGRARLVAGRGGGGEKAGVVGGRSVSPAGNPPAHSPPSMLM